MATLARFFSSEIGFELVRGVRVHAEREVTLELDYAALKARADIPDLFAAIEMAPVEALPCLRAAVHEVVFNSPVGRKELPGLQVHPAAAKVARPPRVDIHLVNHLDARITFDQLRSKNIGRLVSIRGTVVRVGGVKPIVKSLVFVCEKCEFQQTKHLADGKYAEPESCPAPGCRGRKFTADHDSAKCSDWQRVRLQEISDDAVEEHARTPLFAEVEMEATLVDESPEGDALASRVEIREEDALAADVKSASVVVMYLSDGGNAKVLPGLAPLAPGARVVTFTFPLCERMRPTRRTRVDGIDLFVYTKGAAADAWVDANGDTYAR